MTDWNFPHPPLSSACKALWGDHVIRLLALDAWTQFWKKKKKKKKKKEPVDSEEEEVS